MHSNNTDIKQAENDIGNYITNFLSSINPVSKLPSLTDLLKKQKPSEPAVASLFQGFHKNKNFQIRKVAYV